MSGMRRLNYNPLKKLNRKEKIDTDTSMLILTPEVGKFYRIKYYDCELVGVLDHVADPSGEMIMGRFYSIEGEYIGELPIAKSTWNWCHNVPKIVNDPDVIRR